jgi:hypothetical protein
MATYKFRLFGTPEYSLEKPDPTALTPPLPIVIDANITVNQLMEYVQKFPAPTNIQFSASSFDQMIENLLIAVKGLLFPRGAQNKLSATNPIIDVMLNDSRPSGEPDIWRPSVAYAIHPLSNVYVPGGPNSVTVAPGPSAGTPPPYWVTASVVAFKV